MWPLPGAPMEPILWPAPFQDPDWVFQLKWDGIRLLAVVEGRAVQLYSRHGEERTRLYPDLATALPNAVRPHRVVLDGEVVAFRNNKPSFTQIMRRALASHPLRMAERIAAYYVPFDLLEVTGQPLLEAPLWERLARLEALLLPHERVIPIRTHRDGEALFAAVKAEQLEGIVAKQRTSPYRSGKSPLWRKVKVRQRMACAVVGFVARGGQLRSLLLGARDREGAYHFLGAAGSGLTEAYRQRLEAALRGREVIRPPVVDVRTRAGMHWVEPTLAVTVEYLERTEEGHLRHPVIVDFPALPPEACLLPDEL